MQLSQFYPEPKALIDNETKVLAHLEVDPYIAAEQPRFLSDAVQFRKQSYSGRLGFNFASYLDVFHSEMPRVKGPTVSRRNRHANTRLIISVSIEQPTKRSFGNIVYVLAVCRIRSTSPDPLNSSTQPLVVRKFHFDVTTPGANQRQKKPVTHLQYCGTMIPFMAEIGFPDSQLRQMHSKLSEPRLFYWPMSLAFLIDLCFREFPDARSQKFRETNEWRGLLHDSERLIMRPFLSKCVEVVDNAGSSYSTLSDAFYV